MAAAVPDLSTIVPSVGVLGLLAWLIVHIMRQSSGDRSAYAKDLASLRDQYAADIKTVTERHDGEIQDLRLQVTNLRAEVAELRLALEAERKARHHAEDEAAKWRRLIGDANGAA